MNTSPTPTGQSTTQGGQKKGNDVLGPMVHPKYPFLVFSLVLVPNQANQALPTFWFCLWEQGLASYYRYQAKKKDDKTISVLWKSLSAPSAWLPTASEVRPCFAHVQMTCYIVPSSIPAHANPQTL